MNKFLVFVALLFATLSAEYFVQNQGYTPSEVAQMGQHTNYAVEMINKQGYNTDIDATYENIWVPGGDCTANEVTITRAISIVSDSAADDRDPRVIRAVSTSANETLTLRISGIDENGVSVTEDLVLDGTTIVQTTEKFEYFTGYTLMTFSPSGDISISDESAVALVTVASTNVAGYSYTQDKEETVTQSTGAGIVIVKGLDINYEKVQERVVLNGATPVVLNTTMLRVNEVYVLNTGTSGSNTGVITVSANGASLTTIPALLGTDQRIMHTVPAGKMALIVDSSINLISGSTPNIRLKYKPYGESWKDAGFRVGKSVNILFKEKTEIMIEAKGANSNLEISLDLIVYNN